MSRPDGLSDPPLGRGPRRSPRSIPKLALLFALVLAVVALAVRVGPRELSTSAVWTALVGTEGPLHERRIVRELRLPRAIVGLLVGASLAVSGAILQGMTRNALASPSLLGLNSGAACAIVLAMSLCSRLDPETLALVSFLGAASGTALVYGVGSLSSRGLTPTRLALAGTAVSAFLASVTSLLLIRLDSLSDVLSWTVGGFGPCGWDSVIILLPIFVPAIVAAACLSHRLTILSLGEESAAGLGLSVRRVRAAGMLLALLLAGGAVSVAGPVASVGLLVPHVARRFVGFDYRSLLPASALGGALTVGVADILARTIPVYRSEVPAGVFTSILGIPCFFALARARSRRGGGAL
jgi:iron complex transport system permease protein